ncbi:DUF2306 domain-containing protein [Tenacibaculum sp. M341]|uniref:DUF2306 domain-containing protein n=1 Tax=Tenacibaculum sp. M341 TaxID=2530339 RepID=UPI001052AEF5|nr:DUF2306 domain-containing protein [Tenacibaculum sp. M341]TCI84872.1 DUF2306 domain-containing protein [Tenacibaculum sp. M341]
METFIQTLIIIHASFGGIALVSGLISMIAKKGEKMHKKSGLLFYYSMMLCGISAMIIAVLPNHENPFLFAIGIFSSYFVLTGNRVLNFKNKNLNLSIDKYISITMIITGILMIFLPILVSNSINIVLVVFAIIGIVFSIRDLILYTKPKQLKKSWLKLHLGKMIGGYISASTAFIVVNNFFPSFYGWFIPSIIGSFLIAYWMKKLNNKRVSNSQL